MDFRRLCIMREFGLVLERFADNRQEFFKRAEIIILDRCSYHRFDPVVSGNEKRIDVTHCSPALKTCLRFVSDARPPACQPFPECTRFCKQVEHLLIVVDGLGTVAQISERQSKVRLALRHCVEQFLDECQVGFCLGKQAKLPSHPGDKHCLELGVESG